MVFTIPLSNVCLTQTKPCSLVLLVPPALPYTHAHARVYVCVRINNTWQLRFRTKGSCTKDTYTKRRCLWRASTDLLDKASHLTAFCAWDSSHHLPVTLAQLMRPGFGQKPVQWVTLTPSLPGKSPEWNTLQVLVYLTCAFGNIYTNLTYTQVLQCVPTYMCVWCVLFACACTSYLVTVAWWLIEACFWGILNVVHFCKFSVLVSAKVSKTCSVLHVRCLLHGRASQW